MSDTSLACKLEISVSLVPTASERSDTSLACKLEISVSLVPTASERSDTSLACKLEISPSTTPASRLELECRLEKLVSIPSRLINTLLLASVISNAPAADDLMRILSPLRDNCSVENIFAIL